MGFTSLPPVCKASGELAASCSPDASPTMSPVQGQRDASWDVGLVGSAAVFRQSQTRHSPEAGLCVWAAGVLAAGSSDITVASPQHRDAPQVLTSRSLWVWVASNAAETAWPLRVPGTTPGPLGPRASRGPWSCPRASLSRGSGGHGDEGHRDKRAACFPTRPPSNTPPLPCPQMLDVHLEEDSIMG